MSPIVAQLSRLSARGQKKWPGKPGPFVQSTKSTRPAAQAASASETSYLQASEAEIREVAVAHRRAGPGHQQAVDRGHQAARWRGGRREADRRSLGHYRPLF